MTKARKLNITKFPYHEYDDDGRILYREYVNGAWEKATYDKQGRQITFESNGTVAWKRKFDKNGNLIYIEHSFDNNIKDWMKKIYKRNQIISYEDSDGNFWNKKLMPNIPYPY